MEPIAAIYTWQTGRGELSVYAQNGQPKFCLLIKVSNQQVVISNDKISGIPFESLEKMQDVWQNLLPVIIKNDEYVIKFHYSTTYNCQKIDEKPRQTTKGDFGFDFNKLEVIFHIEFDRKAPYYRKVCRGLNLEGKCIEKTCDAFNKKVIIPIGIGKFNVPEEIAERGFCTASCGGKLKFKNITNLGFWDCTYIIQGNLDKEKVSRPEETAPADKYRTFETGDEGHWTYLNIETKLIVVEEESACTLF